MFVRKRVNIFQSVVVGWNSTIKDQRPKTKRKEAGVLADLLMIGSELVFTQSRRQQHQPDAARHAARLCVKA